MKLAFAILLLTPVCFAQQPKNQAANAQQAPSQAAPAVTIPTGTRTLLVLLSPISTKSAHPGDGVYMQTAVPITADKGTAIPAGSYIQGVINRAVRPGRIKGRAELQIHFTKVTFPSGYAENLPASLAGVPAEENAKVTGEGTLQENPQHGQDAGILLGSTGTGLAIGGAANGGRGAGIGAGVGAAVGLATVLLTRGNEIRLQPGDAVEMVFDRPLVLHHTESESNGFQYIPRPARNERTDQPRYPAGYPVGYPGGVWPPVVYRPR